jgi:hypothetical protein
MLDEFGESGTGQKHRGFSAMPHSISGLVESRHICPESLAFYEVSHNAQIFGGLHGEIHDATILEFTILPDILMYRANLSTGRPNYADIVVAMLFRPALYVIRFLVTFQSSRRGISD